MGAPPQLLPDVLRPGLRIVFCGTAAGTVSAARGAYYAHPQNKFWRVLYAIRLTPRLVRPEEYSALPEWGLGLTDIAKHVSGMDRELPSGALGDEACAALTAKILAVHPVCSRSPVSPAVGAGSAGRRASATAARVSVRPASGSCLRLRRRRAGTGTRPGGGSLPRRPGTDGDRSCV